MNKTTAIKICNEIRGLSKLTKSLFGVLNDDAPDPIFRQKNDDISGILQ